MVWDENSSHITVGCPHGACSDLSKLISLWFPYSPVSSILQLYPPPLSREWRASCTERPIHIQTDPHCQWTQRAVLSSWLSVGQCPGVEEEEGPVLSLSSSAFRLILMLWPQRGHSNLLLAAKHALSFRFWSSSLLCASSCVWKLFFYFR